MISLSRSRLLVGRLEKERKSPQGEDGGKVPLSGEPSLILLLKVYNSHRDIL